MEQVNKGPGRGRAAGNSRRRGFTLIEASLTTMIVGVGLVATLQLLAAGTTCNLEATESTMAVNLGRNVREMSLRLTYDQTLALDRQSFSPPIDSRGERIADFAGWTQQITVQPVKLDGLTSDTNDLDPTAVRVTVLLLHNGAEVGRVKWYRFKPGV